MNFTIVKEDVITSESKSADTHRFLFGSLVCSRPSPKLASSRLKQRLSGAATSQTSRRKPRYRQLDLLSDCYDCAVFPTNASGSSNLPDFRIRLLFCQKMYIIHYMFFCTLIKSTRIYTLAILSPVSESKETPYHLAVILKA